MVGLVGTIWNKPYQLRRIEEAASKARRDQRPAATPTSIPQPRRVDLRLTESQRSTIVAMYLAGRPSRMLALEHAISKTKVIELVREAGHAPRRRGPTPRQP